MEEKEEKKDKEKEQTEDKKNDEKEKRKKLSLKSKIGIFGAVLLVLFSLAFTALYLYPPFEKFARPVFRNFPFPVAIIDNGKSIISSLELIQSTEAVKKFYESQDYAKLNMRVDFSTEDGKKRLKIKEKDVFDKLVENKIIESLANERGIFVSWEVAQAEIDKGIAEGGDRESLELNLRSLYGWTIADFRDNVVVYQMYVKQLLDWYAVNIESSEEYQKIIKAKEELGEDGSNFADVAKKYSEGESSQNQGEVGWFAKDELVTEVGDVAFSMNKGDVSEIIVSPLGFHIVQVVDFEKDETGKIIEKANIRQIFVRGISFLDWLSQRKKEANVRILMKEYVWNKDEGKVFFRDEEMNRIEKKIKLKAEGDPSL